MCVSVCVCVCVCVCVFLDIEKWHAGQISTLRFGETGKSRKLLSKSAYLEQKLLEPQAGRNLYMMILDNLLFKD